MKHKKKINYIHKIRQLQNMFKKIYPYESKLMHMTMASCVKLNVQKLNYIHNIRQIKKLFKKIYIKLYIGTKVN